ncbi:hypothetical protein AKJ16_DCAP18650 [Drosera capensis]
MLNFSRRIDSSVLLAILILTSYGEIDHPMIPIALFYTCIGPLSSQASASSINSGLSLTIKTQNSISFNVPSPSTSPSITIATASSSLIPSIPSIPAFFFKLSGVITPLLASASILNPPHSSVTKASTSNFSAITGNISSKCVISGGDSNV